MKRPLSIRENELLAEAKSIQKALCVLYPELLALGDTLGTVPDTEALIRFATPLVRLAEVVHARAKALNVCAVKLLHEGSK